MGPRAPSFPEEDGVKDTKTNLVGLMSDNLLHHDLRSGHQLFMRTHDLAKMHKEPCHPPEWITIHVGRCLTDINAFR